MRAGVTVLISMRQKILMPANEMTVAVLCKLSWLTRSCLAPMPLGICPISMQTAAAEGEGWLWR